MHYSVVGLSTAYELNLLTNAVATLFDVSMLCLIYSPVSKWKHTRWVVVVPTLCYCLCNVWYARVFGSYMPLAAFTQTQNLHGLGDSILSCIRWWDVVLVAIVAMVTYKSDSTAPVTRQRLTRQAVVAATCFALLIATRLLHVAVYGSMSELRDHIAGERASYSNQPNLFEYKFGVTIKTMLDILHSHTPRELTPTEQAEIQAYMDTRTYASMPTEPQRVIFIVVESLVTTPINMSNDSVMITPTLNRLAHTSIYYPNMCSQVQCGGSSDGQFIYMTGLLPLQSGITVVNYGTNEYQALGHAAKRRSMRTVMINPATHDFWMQDRMCRQYGIDEQYSIEQYESTTGRQPRTDMLQDDEIFDYALAVCRLHADEPLFITILTYSMHLPYDAGNPMADYLRKAQFTDLQLGRFIDSLNADGLMEGTVLAIASDHHAPTLCDDDRNQMLPFIIHGTGLPDTMRTDTVGQIDVYSTLANIIGHDIIWKGLGRSLLDDNPATMDEDGLLHLSRLIIESNHLKN